MDNMQTAFANNPVTSIGHDGKKYLIGTRECLTYPTLIFWNPGSDPNCVYTVAGNSDPSLWSFHPSYAVFSSTPWGNKVHNVYFRVFDDNVEKMPRGFKNFEWVLPKAEELVRMPEQSYTMQGNTVAFCFGDTAIMDVAKKFIRPLLPKPIAEKVMVLKRLQLLVGNLRDGKSMIIKLPMSHRRSRPEKCYVCVAQDEMTVCVGNDDGGLYLMDLESD